MRATKRANKKSRKSIAVATSPMKQNLLKELSALDPNNSGLISLMELQLVTNVSKELQMKPPLDSLRGAGTKPGTAVQLKCLLDTSSLPTPCAPWRSFTFISCSTVAETHTSKVSNSVFSWEF